MLKALSQCAKKFHRAAKLRLAHAAEAARDARSSVSWSNVACENLENRTLMSNSVTLSNGVLNIQGNATVGCNLTVYLVNSGTNIDASADEGHAIIVAKSSVKSIHITGGSGNDYIFVDGGVTVPVTISGGDGNDNVRGGGGYNNITEGNGNNWVNIGGTGGYAKVGNGKNVVDGSNGNDTIVAGDGNNLLDGSNGNDSITAGNGNDTVTADAGNDTVVVGNGTDSVNGGLGDDHLTLGTGASTVIPGSGTNYIVLGNPKTIVVPSSGSNTVVNASGQTVSSPVSSTAPPAPLTWQTYAAAKSSAGSPQAIIRLFAPTAVVGAAVDVDGTTSVVGTGSAIDADYIWNFGDSTGVDNAWLGFNSSHVYTEPGVYQISLTVENSAYKSSTAYATITIAADNRRAIYVDAVHGNDKNNGSTPALAVQTAAYADSLMRDNTEVFFDRGEEFNLAKPFLVHFRNVIVGAYGSGNQPIINYTAPGNGSVIFSTNSSSSIGDTIQDLSFTTLNFTSTTAGLPMAVMAGGYDIAVLRNTFQDVEYDVNGSGEPVGLTVEGNSSPSSTGLQGYFVWDEGSYTSIMGNYVNGSIHEHVVRTSGSNVITVSDNNFINNDGKGCIEIHIGSLAWIEGNSVTNGDIRVGPLGLWNEPANSATNTCVIENNTVHNSDIQVYPGAHDISIRNNIIYRNSGAMVDISGSDTDGRLASDIRILNNTGISTSSTGNFLDVENHTNGITLENNLLVQPNLAVGAYNGAPVLAVEGNLSSFTYINGNVWQEPKTFYSTASGGINLAVKLGALTPAVWNAQPQVGTDYFANTTLNSSNGPTSNTIAAYGPSVPVPGVFIDYYYKPRPLSGVWTTGAVEL